MDAHLVRRLTAVLIAALKGDENDLRQALSALNQSELSRLRNAMHLAADVAEQRRKQLWRLR